MGWFAAGAAFLAMLCALGAVWCTPASGMIQEPGHPGYYTFGVMRGSERWSKSLGVASAILGGLSGVLGVFAAT